LDSIEFTIEFTIVAFRQLVADTPLAGPDLTRVPALGPGRLTWLEFGKQVLINVVIIFRMFMARCKHGSIKFFFLIFDLSAGLMLVKN
jgi:hypothetical protein